MEIVSDFVVPQSYNQIRFVNPNKQNAIYEVRVLKKWKLAESLASETLDALTMVLIDKDKYKIQAFVPSEVLPMFEDKISENGVYILSSLSVEEAIGFNLASYHRYRFIFNEHTKLEESDNFMIPNSGLSLIGIESIREKEDDYNYLIDVVGVVTAVQHEKNFYSDSTFDESITIQLNERKKSIKCELSGDLMKEFETQIGSSSKGLPVVIFQFVQITTSQGRKLIKGVNGVTRLFVNPYFPEAIHFRKGLSFYLGRNLEYSGLLPNYCYMPESPNFQFLDEYDVMTIDQLKKTPRFGTYIVNARISDILDVTPWYYPVCKCVKIFEEYIGKIECKKCEVTKFIVAPKVRITFEVEDNSGRALFKCFDHVMVNVAAPNSSFKGITVDLFYHAFRKIMGKSIMFMVEKNTDQSNFLIGKYEMTNVSDNEIVLNFFNQTGHYKTVSKKWKKKTSRDVHAGVRRNYRLCTSTVSDLVDKYLEASTGRPDDHNVASTSLSKRRRI